MNTLELAGRPHTLTSHALYSGRVVHHRHGDIDNRFDVRVTMAWINVDEVDSLEGVAWSLSSSRGRPLRFRRRDFHGDPAVPLGAAIRATVNTALGIEVDGPICALANLALFGWNFNPLATYYCFNRSGDAVVATVLEVTNTPWGERHSYVVGAGDVHTVEKVHHVSPFLEMDLTYEITAPAPSSSLSLRFRVHPRAGGPERFSASLALRRHALTEQSVRELLTHPWRGAPGVSARIYTHAALLATKRAPFFVHPNKATQ